MDINAIETRYAGHRFRSRLEARWAVFMDRLGVSWEYEPEGYTIKVGSREVPYLPDFFLPKLKTWVEVKGSREHLDLDLLDAAVGARTGLPVQEGTSKTHLLILGPVPEPGKTWLHWRVSAPTVPCLSAYCPSNRSEYSQVFFLPKDHVSVDAVAEYMPDGYFEAGFSTGVGPSLVQIGEPMDGGRNRTPLDYTKAVPSGWIIPKAAVNDALRAARSARFEHGESGTS